MARKRYGEDVILRLLRKVEVHCISGMVVVSVCRKAGISDNSGWRRKYGGMSRARLTEINGLEQQNQRIKKIVSVLALDNPFLKDSLDYLKPKA